jgi:hypothetical protein
MPTFEEVRARIKRNMPAPDKKRDGTLQWDRETMTTIISSCGIYRISKMGEGGLYAYWVSLCATPISAAQSITGPYRHPREARQAAQDYNNGEPMQADLA